jgi:hypothetical protein
MRRASASARSHERFRPLMRGRGPRSAISPTLGRSDRGASCCAGRSPGRRRRAKP